VGNDLAFGAATRDPSADRPPRPRCGAATPEDEEEDYALPVWSGVLPLALVPGDPVPDARLDPAVSVPSYVSAWDRRGPALRQTGK
jgi:hypothetical protein